ncbi:hypothetical protein AcW1_009941 [Taiwanofungus camphoratus]|nr:hypothetical protein AcW1_009941 [Antrodia cinnamomea]
MSVFYDLVTDNEVHDAHKIEVAGYPVDEAASLEAFQYRQSQAPDLFLGAYLPSDSGRTLVGYVCSTLSPSHTLTHESMSKHIPGASSVCIHSICVSPAHRRKGIALNLLREYLTRLEGGAAYERVLLISHEELTGLYEQAGFEWVGQSGVVHGTRPWFEMRRLLSPPRPPQVEALAVPAGLWEALQRSSVALGRPRARLLSAFPRGVLDVVADRGQGAVANKVDLLCPRDGCGSVIAKNNVAQLVERASVQLEPAELSSYSPLAPLPPPPETTEWWLITPNAMAFENIGFTRPVDPKVSGSKALKFLICAECDLGPLGWCEEGGSEFWLACSRVGYRE